MTDRISHRAAVEAGYASLAEYITEWKDRPDEGYADQRTLEIVAHLHCENERLREALKECARPFKGTLPDWESAARALTEELQRRIDVALKALQQKEERK